MQLLGLLDIEVISCAKVEMRGLENFGASDGW
jgi:hypothetical protein